MRQWEIELEESLKELDDNPWLRELKKTTFVTMHNRLQHEDLSKLTESDFDRIIEECYNEIIKIRHASK